MMNTEQKIKKHLILTICEDDIEPIKKYYDYDFDLTQKLDEHNIDSVFFELYDYLQDDICEFRCGGEPTGLESDWGRNYECDAVAAQLSCGTWVGWNYYYGGGKHSEPDAIPWIEFAYELNAKEEEKTVVVRTFTRVEDV